MSCSCKRHRALQSGVEGWSAVFDCGTVFPDHTHLLLDDSLRQVTEYKTGKHIRLAGDLNCQNTDLELDVMANIYMVILDFSKAFDAVATRNHITRCYVISSTL